MAMNRNGVLAILDEKGREKERYSIVYGAKLKVRTVQQVELGLSPWSGIRTLSRS